MALRAIGLLSACAWIIALIALAASGPAIALLLGDTYAGSLLLFRVLCLALLLVYPNYVMMQLLAAAGHQRLVMLAAAAGAACNIALNLALVPRHDALGAAFATVGTEAIVCCVLGTMTWASLREGRRSARRAELGVLSATRA
jgi:O-antigen/teichoic acid export membrane protein